MDKIREISWETALPLRQEVMWPDKPLSFSRIDHDPEGVHFGYFHADVLIGVISVFIQGDRAQFRKFATRVVYQGQGIGTMLFRHVETYVLGQGVKTLWCNARLEKTSFYEKLGMSKTNQVFDKAGQQYIIMEKDVL